MVGGGGETGGRSPGEQGAGRIIYGNMGDGMEKSRKQEFKECGMKCKTPLVAT